MMLNPSQIKPDPDQPRRTFDAEKMRVLEGSMRDNGFREGYPIIIDAENVIVDGERRWRAAKKVGIKSVPVIVVKDIEPWKRLVYQLQSEGAELQPVEKYEAWAKLYDEAKDEGFGYDTLAKKIGEDSEHFKKRVIGFRRVEEMITTLKAKGTSGTPSISDLKQHGYRALEEVTAYPDKKVAQKLVVKATKEDWTRDKATEIKKALTDRPDRVNQILSQDYTDETPGSNLWKMKLEVAKAGFTGEDADEMNRIGRDTDQMYGQVRAFSDIIMYGLKMAAAMREFDYTSITPTKRIELHQKLQKFIPFATGYITKLETYMIEKGELQRNVKLIK